MTAQNNTYPLDFQALELAVDRNEHPYVRLIAASKVIAHKCLSASGVIPSCLPMSETINSTTLTFELSQLLERVAPAGGFLIFDETTWINRDKPNLQLGLPARCLELSADEGDGAASLTFSAWECSEHLKDDYIDPYVASFVEPFTKFAEQLRDST